MDNLIKMLNIMDIIKCGPITLEELMDISGISYYEAKNMLDFLYNFDLLDYLHMKVYKDENKNLLYDLYDLCQNKNKFEAEFKKLIIEIDGNCKFTETINDLNKDQLWILYKLFKYCGSNFTKDITEIYFSKYNCDFEEKYDYINSKLIIKQYLSIFQSLDENMFMYIYNAIDKKFCLNLKIKGGGTIYDVSPIKMYFNDEVNTWYLKYYKKRHNNIIKLEKIASVEKSPYRYKEKAEKYNDLNGEKKFERIKFKIYNEKNAIEMAFRFLSRKDIKSIRNYENYVEYEVNIRDVNLFMRWAREHSPQLIIEKPVYLKNRMIKEILQWEELYN